MLLIGAIVIAAGIIIYLVVLRPGARSDIEDVLRNPEQDFEE